MKRNSYILSFMMIFGLWGNVYAGGSGSSGGNPPLDSQVQDPSLLTGSNPVTGGGGGGEPITKQIEALNLLDQLLAGYPLDEQGLVIVPDYLWEALIPTLKFDWNEIDLNSTPYAYLAKFQTAGILVNRDFSALEMNNIDLNTNFWVVRESQQEQADEFNQALAKWQELIQPKTTFGTGSTLGDFYLSSDFSYTPSSIFGN